MGVVHLALDPTAGPSRSRCCARTSPTTATPAPGWPARSRRWRRVAGPRASPPSSTPTSTATGPTSSPATSPGRRSTSVVGRARPAARRRAAAARAGPGRRARRPSTRAGVVHRDLKPGNVLLLDGDPVVIDFGIAHVADDVRLTMTGLVMGTPGYLSPEVVEGAPVTDGHRLVGLGGDAGLRRAAAQPPFGRGPMDVVLDRVQPRRGRPHRGRPAARPAPVRRAVAAAAPSVRTPTRSSPPSSATPPVRRRRCPSRRQSAPWWCAPRPHQDAGARTRAPAR